VSFGDLFIDGLFNGFLEGNALEVVGWDWAVPVGATFAGESDGGLGVHFYIIYFISSSFYPGQGSVY